MLTYKLLKQTFGVTTGHFYDFEEKSLIPVLESALTLIHNKDFNVRANDAGRELVVQRLGESKWTPEEIQQIDSLVAQHGSQVQCDYRKALKNCYDNRVKAYAEQLGSVTDQLDVILKGGDAFADLQKKHTVIKAEFPKPKEV